MRQGRRGIIPMKTVFPIRLFQKNKNTGKGFFPLWLKPPQNSANHRGKLVLTKTPLQDAVTALTPPERGGGTALAALQMGTSVPSSFTGGVEDLALRQGLSWGPGSDPNAGPPRSHTQETKSPKIAPAFPPHSMNF